MVRALAEEIDELQVRDREQLVYEQASRTFLEAVSKLPREGLLLPEGHQRLVALAEMHLPTHPGVVAS